MTGIHIIPPTTTDNAAINRAAIIRAVLGTRTLQTPLAGALSAPAAASQPVGVLGQ